MITGWYYLHENGALIYRQELGGTAADIRESPFAKALWPIDVKNREYAWTVLIEAFAAGANLDRVRELADKWVCDDDDADIYAQRIGISFERDGNAWCAIGPRFVNLQESPCGFGTTKLEAMAGLCKALGYRPSKMWGASFRDLVAAKAKEPKS